MRTLNAWEYPHFFYTHNEVRIKLGILGYRAFYLFIPNNVCDKSVYLQFETREYSKSHRKNIEYQLISDIMFPVLGDYFPFYQLCGCGIGVYVYEYRCRDVSRENEWRNGCRWVWVWGIKLWIKKEVEYVSYASVNITVSECVVTLLSLGIFARTFAFASNILT